MTVDDVREQSAEVWAPTDDDYDPDRVERDKEQNWRIARGARIARSVFQQLRDSENEHWEARFYTTKGRTIAGLGSTMAEALANLGDLVDSLPNAKE